LSSPFQKKVLIAMTGRRDSTVAAYLLKKQGYQCIGISFLFSDEIKLQQQVDLIHNKVSGNEDVDTTSEVSSEKKLISKEKLYSRCHIPDISQVANICEKLDILFYGVKSADRFSAAVTDKLVANKLSGKSFQSCVDCNNVKFSLLVEKAKELGCDYISTGHYAKVVENQKTGHFYIHAANDLEHDQSYLLSRLPQESLKKLILPLSETRLKEVEKIMQMIGLKLPFISSEDIDCFQGDLRLPSLVEVCSAASLLRKGNFFLEHENLISSEHRGIHHFEVGQTNLNLGSDSKASSKLIVNKIVPTNGTVIVSPIKDIYFDRLLINKVILDPMRDISKPFQGFVKIGIKSDMQACHVYFKNFNTIMVVFKKIFVGIITTGTTIAIYNKIGISGKIITSGEVQVCGVVDKGELTNYIGRVDEVDEDDEKESSYIALPEFFH
jgi:tRNA-uridine 2-sulfurtransferase